MSYLLAKHVFVCLQGGQVVFLDLKEDKYLAMDAEKACRIIEFSPVEFPSEEFAGAAAASSQTNLDKAAKALIDRGLLTADRAEGKEAVPARIDPPVVDFVNDAPQDPALRMIDVARFLAATMLAWVRLHCMSLEKAVMHVGRRRLEHCESNKSPDLRIAKRCVAAFERIRPFVFSARDKCLFDSLVLIEYLARYGIYPMWVFGVHVAPFGAHCWVQQESVVFNDSAEHASEFTPILVV
jgi:hypothetical protein